MNTEQTVSAAVAGLRLGGTFTFDELRRSVQDQRHRRLRVIELADLDTHDGLCALWLATDTDDLVLHARTDLRCSSVFVRFERLDQTTSGSSGLC